MKLLRVTEEVDDRLEVGIDWIGADPKRAASIFLKLTKEYPEHIDAHHPLALTLEKMGKDEEAFQTWEKAVTTALKFFPPHFTLDHDRLKTIGPLSVGQDERSGESFGCRCQGLSVNCERVIENQA